MPLLPCRYTGRLDVGKGHRRLLPRIARSAPGRPSPGARTGGARPRTPQGTAGLSETLVWTPVRGGLRGSRAVSRNHGQTVQVMKSWTEMQGTVSFPRIPEEKVCHACEADNRERPRKPSCQTSTGRPPLRVDYDRPLNATGKPVLSGRYIIACLSWERHVENPDRENPDRQHHLAVAPSLRWPPERPRRAPS